MLLKKGDHTRVATNAAMIKYWKQHGYVEVHETGGAVSSSVSVLVGEAGDGREVFTPGRRSKKADQPPADLGELADDLSKDEDSD